MLPPNRASKIVLKLPVKLATATSTFDVTSTAPGVARFWLIFAPVSIRAVAPESRISTLPDSAIPTLLPSARLCTNEVT